MHITYIPCVHRQIYRKNYQHLSITCTKLSILMMHLPQPTSRRRHRSCRIFVMQQANHNKVSAKMCKVKYKSIKSLFSDLYYLFTWTQCASLASTTCIRSLLYILDIHFLKGQCILQLLQPVIPDLHFMPQYNLCVGINKCDCYYTAP